MEWIECVYSAVEAFVSGRAYLSGERRSNIVIL